MLEKEELSEEEKKKLSEVVNFYLMKGDLSHQRYEEELREPGDADVFQAVGRLFDINQHDAEAAWAVACGFLSLYEGELLDGGEDVGDMSEVKNTDFAELLKDHLVENGLDRAERKKAT